MEAVDRKLTQREEASTEQMSDGVRVGVVLQRVERFSLKTTLAAQLRASDEMDRFLRRSDQRATSTDDRERECTANGHWSVGVKRQRLEGNKGVKGDAAWSRFGRKGRMKEDCSSKLVGRTKGPRSRRHL